MNRHLTARSMINNSDGCLIMGAEPDDQGSQEMVSSGEEDSSQAEECVCREGSNREEQKAEVAGKPLQSCGGGSAWSLGYLFVSVAESLVLTN